MRTRLFAILFTTLVFLVPGSLAHAQVPNLPNVAAPLTGSANNPASGGIPAGPNNNGSSAAAPLNGSADNPAAGTPSAPAGGASSNNQPAAQTGSFLQLSLPNNHGLPGSSGPQNLLNTVISNALNFLALIAICALIFAGVQLVTAQGKADAIGSAKGNIINIIIGFAIVMLAWSGVNIILQFIGFGS